MKPDKQKPEEEAKKPDEEQATQEKIARTRGVVASLVQREKNELARRREAKEISQFDFDLNFIFSLNETGFPLKRKDLEHKTGIQAVVINREELETLGCLDFITASGERMLIEPESLREGDVLILYPEDLGDEEGKPAK